MFPRQRDTLKCQQDRVSWEFCPLAPPKIHWKRPPHGLEEGTGPGPLRCPAVPGSEILCPKMPVPSFVPQPRAQDTTLSSAGRGRKSVTSSINVTISRGVRGLMCHLLVRFVPKQREGILQNGTGTFKGAVVSDAEPGWAPAQAREQGPLVSGIQESGEEVGTTTAVGALMGHRSDKGSRKQKRVLQRSRGSWQCRPHPGSRQPPDFSSWRI